MTTVISFLPSARERDVGAAPSSVLVVCFRDEGLH